MRTLIDLKMPVPFSQVYKLGDDDAVSVFLGSDNKMPDDGIFSAFVKHLIAVQFVKVP